MITQEDKILIHKILTTIKDRERHSVSEIEFKTLCNHENKIMNIILNEDMIELENNNLFLTEFGFSVIEKNLLLPPPLEVPNLKTAFSKVQKDYKKKESKPTQTKVFIYISLAILTICCTLYFIW